MHYAGKFNDQSLRPPRTYLNHCEGYTQASLISHDSGSIDTGLTMNQLDAGGTVAPHLHSYEKGFYVLSGQVLLSRNDEAHLLRPGDYGVIKVGTIHAWRNTGTTAVRWLQISAPQPKPDGQERDTFFERIAAFRLKENRSKPMATRPCSATST